MTAKRKPRGVLARLDVLEEAHGERVEGVRAENWAALQAAEARLSAADRAAWQDAAQIIDEGGATQARIRRACAHLPDALPVEHPAKEEADAWADAALDVPDGVALLAPPADRVPAFLAYFGECAAWCDAQAVRVPLSPDVPAWTAGARRSGALRHRCAAHWRR